MELSGAGLVVDIGAGTGALLAAIRKAAPAARTVSLDASARLQIARARREAAAVLADALTLPLADACAGPSRPAPQQTMDWTALLARSR
jgi:ubiquinone/menaquinone biosynthesis C-methylase UbiE